VAYIVGGALLAAVALLVLASHTGRVQVRACRGVADPRRDLRMRAAFTDDESPTRRTGPQRSALGDAWFRAPRESRLPRTGSPQIPPRIRVDVAEFAQAQQVESGMAGHGAGGLTSLGGLDAIV
jgi:hypothetical protein